MLANKYEEKREVVAKDEELTYAMMDGCMCLIRQGRMERGQAGKGLQSAGPARHQGKGHGAPKRICGPLGFPH